MAVVVAPAGPSFGDSSLKMEVYAAWELKDVDTGVALTNTTRVAVFQEWAARMMVKTMSWEKVAADKWVLDVLKPNGITCCYELVEALDTKVVPRSSWVTLHEPGKVLKVSDSGPLRTLQQLAKNEVQAIGNTTSRVPQQPGGTDGTQLLLAMAMGGGHGRMGGVGLANFPGIAQSVADSKRIRKEQLRQLLTSSGLSSLFEEVLPGEKLMTAIDNGLNSGNEHVAANINDLVELFDEWVPEGDWGLGGDTEESPQLRKPAKGEAWGLSHHLLKLLVFMVALRLRGKVDEAHVLNMLYFVLKHYRSEINKEVGMHYAQELFNRLHKKSWWSSKGTLKEALLEPNKEVVESLRMRYPKSENKFQGGKPTGKFSGGKPTGKNVWTQGNPGGKDYGKGKYGQGKGYQQGYAAPYYGNQQPQFAGRVRSRSRGRAEQRDGSAGKPKKDGGKGFGKSKDTGKAADPRAQKAFSLAKEGGRTCPWYQVGTCNYPDSCKFSHECYICKDKRHGAARCYDLSSQKAKDRLGM